jgi:hypothetical protein
VKILLANSEPSTHGTLPTLGSAEDVSSIGGQADVRETTSAQHLGPELD